MEKHKIFISGLPFSFTKEQLAEACKDHGTVKDVRLVTYRSGKPKVRPKIGRTVSRCLSTCNHLGAKLCNMLIILLEWQIKVRLLTLSCFLALQGLAYVEFADEAQASHAVLKMDGMVVEDNKISVAISNPPRRNMDKPGSSRSVTDIVPRQVYGA